MDHGDEIDEDRINSMYHLKNAYDDSSGNYSDDHLRANRISSDVFLLIPGLQMKFDGYRNSEFLKILIVVKLMF